MYYQIIKLSCENITESPQIRHMSMFKLDNFRSEPLLFLHPCHDQDVEHHVKLVTEASKSVSEYNNHDGVI